MPQIQYMIKFFFWPIASPTEDVFISQTWDTSTGQRVTLPIDAELPVLYTLSPRNQDLRLKWDWPFVSEGVLNMYKVSWDHKVTVSYHSSKKVVQFLVLLMDDGAKVGEESERQIQLRNTPQTVITTILCDPSLWTWIKVEAASTPGLVESFSWVLLSQSREGRINRGAETLHGQYL